MSHAAIPAHGERLLLDRPALILGAILGLLVLGAFAPTLGELAAVWFRWPEYGHGLLMPPVAAWLIWTRRKRLSALRQRCDAADASLRIAAAVALAPVVAILLFGEAKLWWGLKPFAFVAAVTAGVTVLWGVRGLLEFKAPLLVLLLMCPLPYRLHTELTLPLKRHATVLATGLLDLSGLDATLEGNLIHIPQVESLWIADACSGIRSLISLVSVAILACILWHRHWIVRLLVIASCVPIAVLVNGLRIWLTGMLSYHVSPDAAQGFFHVFEGFLLFGCAALILWGWALLLDRLLPLARPGAGIPSPAAAPGLASRLSRCARAAAAGLVLTLLAGGLLGVHLIRARLGEETSREEGVARLTASLSQLPLEVDRGTYRGEPVRFDEKVIEGSGADAYVSATYADAAGRSYQVYVGASLGNDENFHAPNVCMPAAGWEALENETVAYEGEAADSVERMRRMLLQRGNEKMLVFYWFQTGGHRAGTEWAVRLRRLRDIFADLFGGAPLAPTQICTVYVPVVGGAAATEEAARRFLRAISTHLHGITTSGEAHG